MGSLLIQRIKLCKMNLKEYIGCILLITITYIVIYFSYIRNDEEGAEKPNTNTVYTQILNQQVTVNNVIKVSSVQEETKPQFTKYILYWTKMFDREDFYYGLGEKPFENCEYKNCFTTANKYFMDVKDFDALMFHGPFYDHRRSDKPWARSDHQRYIYANLESPDTYNNNLNNLNGFYNWTMTYRMDSDIPNPYGYYVKSKRKFEAPSKENLRKRKKLVAWFVSSCDVSSKREKLVNKIMEYTKVDIYGKCGDLSCPKDNKECYELLENNYKFYLSFENSYCKDYVTEKLFNIHNLSVIPIVYGRADYKKIAPPYSYIDVEDFSSVEDLVKYLKYLDKNDDKYLEYFQWKTDYYVVSSFKHFICDLCKKLNTDFTPKTYTNIEKWWKGGKDDPSCFSNKDLPRIVIGS